MKIKIKTITLNNFKCFKGVNTADFKDDVNIIRGRNGVGKTTIADAILWCLFGKNTQGQADFDLKTHNENGKPIPNLDHSVEMKLMVTDGTSIVKPVTLKRTLKETWIKKRGSEEQVFKNNTTEYLVNGDSYTAADYKKYIAQLVSEEVFKAITSPTYFPSLKWQQQREFLTKMIGSIEPECIAGLDDDLVTLVNLLDDSGDDIISYRKHLSYQIKQIKDKLDKIPIRLEEQNKALPESLDYEAIQAEYEQAQKELKEVSEKIISIKSGNGGDVLRAEIRTEIDNIRRDMNTVEDKERISYRTRQEEHNNKVMELFGKFNHLLNSQRDIEQAIPSFDRMIERCNSTLQQCELDAKDIRKQWADNLSRTVSFNESDQFCPTCGQFLPEGQLQEKREKAIALLNESKANVKAKLTKQAEEVKALRADAESKIEELKTKKSEAENSLADTKEQINKVFSEKQKAEKEPVLSYEDALAANSNYQVLLQSREEAQKRLDSVGIDEDSLKQLEGLEARRTECNDTIRRCMHQYSTRDMRLKILALIDSINEEQKDLVRQLSELERKEDVARRYQDRHNAILEERINQHFSIVQWKMFRTVNNGGDPFDEPYCECYVDGVAYHDGLNQAARLNAGLDIINTLCKHYNVSAPIVLDNAESTINILQTIGQQIRLEVADTDLQIV